MKVSDLIDKLGFTRLTKSDFNDRCIKNCYIGDLLSWVMGKAQKDDAWITIMNNMNIVAVATLTDCACIILCEGVNLNEAVLNKANEEGIIILQTNASSYEAACKISKLI